MEIVEVSSREFRQKQKTFFDLADIGTQVVLKRGNKRSYILIPVEDGDLFFTRKMTEKIEQSRQQAIEGKVTSCKNKNELNAFLDSL